MRHAGISWPPGRVARGLQSAAGARIRGRCFCLRYGIGLSFQPADQRSGHQPDQRPQRIIRQKVHQTCHQNKRQRSADRINRLTFVQQLTGIVLQTMLYIITFALTKHER